MRLPSARALGLAVGLDVLKGRKRPSRHRRDLDLAAPTPTAVVGTARWGQLLLLSQQYEQSSSLARLLGGNLSSSWARAIASLAVLGMEVVDLERVTDMWARPLLGPYVSDPMHLQLSN